MPNELGSIWTYFYISSQDAIFSSLAFRGSAKDHSNQQIKLQTEAKDCYCK